jgi:uncharacterized membrane protein HdeD (DUF308 family)
MKALFIVGIVLVILGILSFFVPVPRTEHHRFDAGDIHVGVNTHHDELLPPWVGVALLAVGGGLLVAGSRKSHT